MCVVKILYINEDDRHGIYDGQINERLVPHDMGIMVYSHNGSTKEGNGRTAGITGGRAREVATEAAIAAPAQGCVPSRGRADNQGAQVGA